MQMAAPFCSSMFWSCRTWITNLLPAMFYYAAHGHIRTLCIYHKNYTIIRQLSVPFTVIFAYAAHKLTQDNRCGPLPYKGWTSVL